jgi:hypothetical protein
MGGFPPVSNSTRSKERRRRFVYKKADKFPGDDGFNWRLIYWDIDNKTKFKNVEQNSAQGKRYTIA